MHVSERDDSIARLIGLPETRKIYGGAGHGLSAAEVQKVAGRYYQKLWIDMTKEAAYPWGEPNPRAAVEAAKRIRHVQAYHR